MKRLTWLAAGVMVMGAASVAMAQDKAPAKPADQKPAAAPATKPADKPAPAKPADTKPATQKPADKPAAGGGMTPEVMAEMAKAGAPGEEHAKLNKYVGRWSATTKMWMSPDQPPMESKVIADVKPMMDGRFFVMNIRGEPMMGMPMPFEGFELFGYDKATKRYFSHWVDNMGTGSMTSYGTADAAGKVFTSEGEYTDPTMGKMKSKSVTTFTDDNTYTMVMTTTMQDGSTSKFELTAKRLP